MKIALVTGANKGIGFETAKQLAQLGYYVYLGSRELDNGTQAVEKLKLLGIQNVDVLEVDVTDTDSLRVAVQRLENETEALDVLVNNAGIAGQQPQNIATVDIANLRNLFDTNFFGAIQCTQQLLPLLKKSEAPRIVNVSSGLASLALHGSGNANAIYDAYSCSKMALNAFTVLLAKEFAKTGFKINSVAPGYTATDLNGFKGTQTAEQAAKVIVKYANLDSDGPTGKFVDLKGELAW